MAQFRSTGLPPTMYLLVGEFSSRKSDYWAVLTCDRTDLPYIDPLRILAESKDDSPAAARNAVMQAEYRRLACLAAQESFVLVPGPQMVEVQLVAEAKQTGFRVETHHLLAATPRQLVARLREAGEVVDEQRIAVDYAASAVHCREAVLRSDAGYVLDASGPGLPVPVLQVHRGGRATARLAPPPLMAHLYAKELQRAADAEAGARQSAGAPARPAQADPRLPMYCGEVVGETPASYVLQLWPGSTQIELRRQDVGELRFFGLYTVVYPELVHHAMEGGELRPRQIRHPRGAALAMPVTLEKLLDGWDRRQAFLGDPREACRRYPELEAAYAALEALQAQRPEARDLVLEYVANSVQLGWPPSPDPPADRDSPMVR